MKTSDFNCKIYAPVFNEIYNSYLNKHEHNHIVLKGGAASGKTENIANNIIFWLMERTNDVAVVIVYSAGHKQNTLTKFIRILSKNNITFDVVKAEDGKVTIVYGDNNQIQIISAKTSSEEETSEKLKTFTLEHENTLKFIWFEEFTATLTIFKTIHAFEYSTSRLLRETRDDSITLYSFNPPKNFTHPVYDWLEHFDGLKIHSTLYDLPSFWQSKPDLEKAEKLRKRNVIQYRNIYLGEKVGVDGLAYNTNNVLTDVKDTYSVFEIFIDNGTKDATTFLLFGYHKKGVHVLDTYYHSGRRDGIKSSPTYVKDLLDFIDNHELERTIKIISDDIDFNKQCRENGLKNARYISDITPKKRSLYYSRLDDLLETGKIKILNTPNNLIVFQQLQNALSETKLVNGVYKSMVKKVDNTKVEESKQLHAIDPLHYFALINYEKLGGTHGTI